MKQQKVKSRRIGVLLIFTLLVMLLRVYGDLTTSMITPEEIMICGEYPNTTTINGIGIYNNANYTLNNVVATLIVNQSGLEYYSALNISLGNILSNSYSVLVPSWGLGCNEAYAGTYKLNIKYTAGNFSAIDPNFAKVLVMASPPNIAEKNTTLSANKIQLDIITDEGAYCRLSESDTDYLTMPTQMQGNLLNHYYVLELDSNDQVYYVRCVDYYNNYMLESEIISIHVDTQKPNIHVNSPLGFFNNKKVLINVTTDEDATCRFSHENIEYQSMTNSLDDAGKKHKKWHSFAEGNHQIYIKCKDSQGNIGQEATNFEIDLPPKADIEIVSTGERIGLGIVEVLLSTSEFVLKPSLTYTFDNTNIAKSMSLEGSGTDWKGFMIITQKSDNLIGSFKFSAKDMAGNVGTAISSGKLFVVDTLAPEPPVDLRADKLSIQIVKLKWYYDGESLGHYNIYRSTKQYVNYADYLDSTKGTEFIDYINVSYDQYFYRISSVDIANNEGELSKEVNVTLNATGKNVIELDDGTAREILVSDVSFAKIKSTLDLAEDLKWELESRISSLQDKTGIEKDILEKLTVIQEISLAKEDAQALVSELTAIKFSKNGDEEVEYKIRGIIENIKEIELNTPSDITITESIESVQLVKPSEITGIIEKLPLSSFKAREIEKYIKANQELNTLVKQEIISFEIKYLDGHSEYLNLIREHFDLNFEHQNDMIIIELIPKSVAKTSGEIEFMNPHQIIREDPIIKFYPIDPEQGIGYIVRSKKDGDLPTGIKTFILYDYDKFDLEKTQEGITGYTSFTSDFKFSKTENIMFFLGFVTIAGLLIYYFVFVKGVRMKSKGDSWEDLHKNAQQEINEMIRIRGKEKEEEEIAQVVESSKKDIREGKQVHNIGFTDQQFTLMVEYIKKCIKDNDLENASRKYQVMQGLYVKSSKEIREKYYKRCVDVQRKIVTIDLMKGETEK